MDDIKLGKRYTTHMPLLIKIVQMSKGPILELGSGIFSTPLLHWLCAEDERKLFTYENNLEYFPFAKRFQSRNHRIRFTKNYKDINTEVHWGVVFIDHSPEYQRGDDAIKLKNSTDYIILHDTQELNHYGYEDVWEHFKYRYDWKFCIPWTSVVSNKFSLDKL